MSKKGEKWRSFLSSKTLAGKGKAHKMAYVSVMTAFCIVANFLEFKFLDNQFSLTIVVALITGVIIGAGFGFTACVLGDFIGFIAHPAYIYMPWVGLSTGMFAFISGAIFNGFPTQSKWGMWVKLFLVSFLTFFVCTIGINSTGFYFYNKWIGFSAATIEYIANRFGGEVPFIGYILYRLILKGQIWNSLFNYLLFFIAIPTLKSAKPLKLHIN